MVDRQHPLDFSPSKHEDLTHSLWAELLHPAAEHPLAQWPPDGEQDWNFNEDDPPAGDEAIAAPTAAEIESLLNGLAVAGAAPPAAQPQSLLDCQPFLSIGAELQSAFLEDVTRCAGRLQTALAHLQTNPAHQPSLNQIHRELHTLKGAAATVGLEDWAETLHDFEDRLQTGNETAQRKPIESLLTWVEQIQSQVETFQQFTPPPAQPAGWLFQRLQQAVRSAAEREGKDVELEFFGDHATIEQSLQQRLFEPLMHLVRNSVCHGIETPTQRLATGKPTSGTIRVEFVSGSGMLIINVTDDGRGLDYDVIRRRGIELGMIQADAVTSVNHLNALIFQPQFSTRHYVSQAAGRGIGMSAVLAAVEDLGGWIQVNSQPNRGFHIQLSVPVGPQVEQVVMFRCADQTFALPAAVVESAGRTVENAIELDLGTLLCSRPLLTHRPTAALVCRLPTAPLAATPPQRVRLLVDQIIGVERLVVQPFSALLRHHPSCTAAAMTASGTTAFLINLQKLVELHHERASNHQSARMMRTNP